MGQPGVGVGWGGRGPAAGLVTGIQSLRRRSWASPALRLTVSWGECGQLQGTGES